MCTIHADSPRKALIKLVNLALQGAPNMTQEYMAELVSETIEMVVQVNRSVDGKRQVTAIAEVVGRQGGNGRHSGPLAARPARCAPDVDGRTPRTIAREVRGRRPAVPTPEQLRILGDRSGWLRLPFRCGDLVGVRLVLVPRATGAAAETRY